jgi:hypothetical protein
MEIRLSENKRDREIKAINTLMHAKSITFHQIDELLGFPSRCCQIMPLGRAFLRSAFSLRIDHPIPSPQETDQHKIWTGASGKRESEAGANLNFSPHKSHKSSHEASVMDINGYKRKFSFISVYKQLWNAETNWNGGRLCVYIHHWEAYQCQRNVCSPICLYPLT